MTFGCDGGRRRAGFDETRALPDPAAHVEVVDFGKMVVLTTTKTYEIRMAAVFMISSATIWLRTGLMPKRLAVLSYRWPWPLWLPATSVCG